jgi:hypothetical protein
MCSWQHEEHNEAVTQDAEVNQVGIWDQKQSSPAYSLRGCHRRLVLPTIDIDLRLGRDHRIQPFSLLDSKE